MSDLRTAAQQALEALERGAIRFEAPIFYTQAITALRAALEQPAMRVNALARWAHKKEDPPDTDWQRGYEAARRWVREVGLPALEQPEPAVWECKAGGLKPLTQRLYEMQPENIQRHYTRICPPQREPLTDEQIDALPWGPHEGNPVTFAEGLRDFARAIERAHGISAPKDAA